MKENPELHQVI